MTARRNSLKSNRIAATAAVLTALTAASACGESAATPPEPPVISAPATDDAVRSPVTVTGTAEAGATITLSISDGASLIGTGSGTAGPDGSFSIELTYEDQAIDTPLQLLVTQATADGVSNPTLVNVLQSALGNTYATAAEAPVYQGADYTDMQIYDVWGGVFLDDIALLEALDDDEVVYFGEQHETAAIHELQLWLLRLQTERHDNVSLAMEHFQADEQDVVDNYLDDAITESQFIGGSDPWPNFATYWLPLVNHMKAQGRPVIATNIPSEALDTIYANGLSSPLAFFNTWNASNPFDASLPPRPVPAWDATYQAYFETGFDYASHGQNWGLTYQEALDYFTDLAIIRDHTMGYWIAAHVDDTSNRILFVGGDWHVQTGIATPDMAAFWSTQIASQSLVTTTTAAGFAALSTDLFEGRAYADYILIYE
ncbi:MAG: ChaN family lipoprotein [bacterium]